MRCCRYSRSPFTTPPLIAVRGTILIMVIIHFPTALEELFLLACGKNNIAHGILGRAREYATLTAL